ncbi:hypothetical protein [Streptomyces silvisoli]|uniref:Uncharacterized protein n=1 Tax=Streptomyces silvisoli TaxID=3034235 RepID=A0ABT5ZT73_9ACTN|nr:hypothetical protein [Streptomyces silvisoli]MDF3293030.1 hypothetical protein [Streptomyces silvisoli]
MWDEAGSAADGVEEIILDGLADAPIGQLPLHAAAGVRAGRRLVLELSLADLYGRTAQAGPQRASVELRHRVTGRVRRYEATWQGEPSGDGGWRARVTVGPAALSEGDAITTWDAWVTLTFRDGEPVTTTLRAGSGLRRRVVVGRRGRVLLLQPYATSSGWPALRVADGPAGARRVLAERFARRMRR